MKQFTRTILLVLAITIFFSVAVLAQGDPPTDPLDVPLDGGLSVLIAAAAGYGARKAHQHHREKKKEQEKV
ncbi:MAG TPA: hypothetical protein VF145_09125 [Chitinophagaceae bacterium]